MPATSTLLHREFGRGMQAALCLPAVAWIVQLVLKARRCGSRRGDRGARRGPNRLALALSCPDVQNQIAADCKNQTGERHNDASRDLPLPEPVKEVILDSKPPGGRQMSIASLPT
jgi:hypothetical protein